MAEEEATPAPEENAEATEAAEAGTEAAAEAPAEAGPPPSLWKPVILSSVISIIGMVVIFKFMFLGPILAKIGDPNATDGNSSVAKHDEGHGEEEKGHGKEEDKAGKGADTSGGEISIVADDDNIVINPAGSNGTRYLLVEIYLTRGNDSDKGFRAAIEAHTKMLKKITMDKLSSLDVQQCTDPSIRPRIMYQLKAAYQERLGSGHPIKDLILATWVMQ
jgi:flagellar basal body-associated protein FliL